MAGDPDPRPARVRSKRLPTILELGHRHGRFGCQVCGGGYGLEKMHLLRGSRKEDDPDLLMVGCGDFGKCRIHPRLDRETDPRAKVLVRSVMTDAQECAIIARIGREGLDRLYPEREGR